VPPNTGALLAAAWARLAAAARGLATVGGNGPLTESWTSSTLPASAVVSFGASRSGLGAASPAVAAKLAVVGAESATPAGGPSPGAARPCATLEPGCGGSACGAGTADAVSRSGALASTGAELAEAELPSAEAELASAEAELGTAGDPRKASHTATAVAPPSPPQPHFFHGFLRAADDGERLTSSPCNASREASDASSAASGPWPRSAPTPEASGDCSCASSRVSSCSSSTGFTGTSKLAWRFA